MTRLLSVTEVRDMKPYSVTTLAERWNCTTNTVRSMIKRGDIRAFHVGTLVRIAAQEVERWESKSTDLEGTGESSSPSGTTKEEIASAVRLARAFGQKPKHNYLSSNVFDLSKQDKDR